MAYTKDIDDANEYFKSDNHLKSYDWTGYDTKLRVGALAQALRELQVGLGREMEDPDDDDTYRDDYAVFEQALYILENLPRKKERGAAAVVDLAAKDDKLEIKRKGISIAPEAKQYFALNTIKVVRG